MLPKQTPITQLLQRYHHGDTVDPGPGTLPSAEDVRNLCEVGLGPIAYHVYGEAFERADPATYALLLSADLTTRAIYGQIDSAAVRLLAELEKENIVPVLLKGICASDEYYEPSYFRLMGDIDILIDRSDVDAVMNRVAALGYQATDDQWRLYAKRGHHHLPAARHPATGLTIEVHTGLFGSAEFFSGASVFLRDVVNGQLVEFDYRGYRASRFTPEFQFIYTLSKWSADEGWAVNIKNINDLIHILKKYESDFDWPVLKQWFRNSPHLMPIWMALSKYLDATGIFRASPGFEALFADTAQVVGPRTLRLQLWLLERYPFSAHSRHQGRFERWCAHSLWLNLSKPGSHDLKLPIALLLTLLRCSNYGRYNPIQIVSFRIRPLLQRLANVRRNA